ncbi:hypothetical protein [Lysinibacillus sp. Bpr_S20]|uniref:hypothetical protein n=1 Tax=Lysinibacillus sp. Bpr_S20 TaxID=2933964 RepID=UPI00201248CF|nr:hypothetical protein [Lysinibacillus sp. Bpr_S20]MCL1700792.1 hypothetical protein [Lysinibacillus sp. Bpr_S20]
MKNKDVIDAWRSVIEGDFVDVKNEWTISKRVSVEQIKGKLNALNDEHAGNLVRHKATTNLYRITHFSVLNENGRAEYAVNYHPFDENTLCDHEKVKFTRPASEFFDGRFEF